MSKESEEKPGWLQRVSRIFGKGQNDKKESLERTMHKAGLDILNDRKLENRILLLTQLQDDIAAPIETKTLKEYVAELKRRHNLLNYAIFTISAPYARAGDSATFSHILHGWSRLDASAKSWILRTEDIVSKAEEDNIENKGQNDEMYSLLERGTVDVRMHVRFLHDNLQKHIWKDAFLIIGKCFMDRDVSERAATVVQNVIPALQAGGQPKLGGEASTSEASEQ
jgi:hypothetical protein